ncbi:hypothetical protein ACFO3D_15200 [Virgibacillus kekensis]|uniref:DUF4179 domain-containing protein n=1 Tax=Virgibacillus kekensis TaxID=202261 RepID=A0ABV9DNI1_9BACI
MKEKFLWIGIILIIISGVANYVYFETKQLSKPIFLDHYIKKPFNLHENQLTFFYLTNKQEPLQVSYVQIDGAQFYPSTTGSGFMTLNQNPTYIPHEAEYSHYYLMRERISFPAEILPEKVAGKEAWSFSEIEVGFTNGKQITADIGKVVLSAHEPERKVFDFRMTSSSSQHINQAAMTAMEPVTINDIVIPFPEAGEHVSIKVDVEQERLKELGAVKNGGKIPEWLRGNKKWKDFDGKLLRNDTLPITLKKNEWMRLMTAVNHDSYFEFEMEIQGTDSTGSPFVQPVMIHDRPELTQEDVERIIDRKAGDDDA